MTFDWLYVKSSLIGQWKTCVFSKHYAIKNKTFIFRGVCVGVEAGKDRNTNRNVV